MKNFRVHSLGILQWASICIGMHLALAASGQQLIERNTMTELSHRFDTLFTKTKIVCFGQFLIDIPENTMISFGPTEVFVNTFFVPGQASRIPYHLEQQLISIEKERKYLTATQARRLPLFGTKRDGAAPGQRIAIGSIGGAGYSIYSFTPIKDDLFIQETHRALPDETEIFEDLNKVAVNLRSRGENEIPTETGMCIDGDFVSLQPSHEKVSLGVRLKDFPDVHFSVKVHRNQDSIFEDDSLEARLKQAAAIEGEWHQSIKYLRRGDRKIGAWRGQEALGRLPNVNGGKGVHEFHYISLGEPNSSLVPELDIQMDTGVQDNSRDARMPSLTDQEAIALWDRLSGSIRVRPTAAAGSTPAPKKKVDLGFTAVAGETCPQSGWWIPQNSKAINAFQPRFIAAEATMPPISITCQRMVWQKLMRIHRVDEADSSWKLIGYNDQSAN